MDTHNLFPILAILKDAGRSPAELRGAVLLAISILSVSVSPIWYRRYWFESKAALLCLQTSCSRYAPGVQEGYTERAFAARMKYGRAQRAKTPCARHTPMHAHIRTRGSTMDTSIYTVCARACTYRRTHAHVRIFCTHAHVRVYLTRTRTHVHSVRARARTYIPYAHAHARTFRTRTRTQLVRIRE
jgi:hypothetical protein